MFAREENGGLHDIYCGFSLSNTVYRWVVAGVSILYSLVMLVPGLVEKMPATHYWTVFSFAVLWFGATTADCQAIYMSYATCNSFFGGSNAAAYGMTNEFECHNARYGLAVAFDFVLSVTFLVYLSMVNPKAAA
ncbi:hypothetical protein EON64_13155 [archaeon]|nr:MAG: hypothetical protein EON64_13155 [archaeon]